MGSHHRDTTRNRTSLKVGDTVVVKLDGCACNGEVHAIIMTMGDEAMIVQIKCTGGLKPIKRSDVIRKV